MDGLYPTYRDRPHQKEKGVTVGCSRPAACCGFAEAQHRGVDLHPSLILMRPSFFFKSFVLLHFDLFLLLQHWDCRYVLLCFLFHGCRGLNSDPRGGTASTLLLGDLHTPPHLCILGCLAVSLTRTLYTPIESLPLLTLQAVLLLNVPWRAAFTEKHWLDLRGLCENLSVWE